MYRIVTTGKFKKDLKTIMKRGYNMKLMDDVVTKLSKGEKLPEKNKDHALIGNCVEKGNAILHRIGY